MPHNFNIIISDTSCLILLSKIDELGLLKQVGDKVYVTSIVKDEFRENLPSWISIVDSKNAYYQEILKMELDEGEASAIALSLEIDNSILIIDELKGRKIAERLMLRYSGTFGLILTAKRQNLIKSVKPILNKIRLTNFRFSDKLFETVLREAGE